MNELKKLILNTSLSEKEIALFYLGQEGFIIKSNNSCIMVDGYLSDYVDRNCCTERVKWVRRYDAPINPADLDFLDYVFCTHEHFDHADPDTISAVAKVNPTCKFIVPRPMTQTIQSYGVCADHIIPAVSDVLINLSGFDVTPIPSAHEELHTDDNGDYLEMGYIFDFDGTKVYHAGDCCLFDGLVEKLNGVDILLVPVNGRSYFKRYIDDIIGNFTSEEAVVLAKEVGADVIVPMHYDLYDVNCIRISHFTDDIEDINPTQKYKIFEPGEIYIYSK